MNEPEATTENKEEPDALKVGSTFPVNGKNVTVTAMELPRMTVTISGNRHDAWNYALQSTVIDLYGHSFLVKAISGRRMYLIKVNIEEPSNEQA